jgi:calcineurin-like phosphoesterase family protein
VANIWFISDTHFGHASTFNKFRVHIDACRFNVQALAAVDEERNECNCPFMRPFTSVEEMDETLVENWNKVVRPQDKVYHLGDVAIKKPYVATVKRCNGHKRLVRGNHDIWAMGIYLHAGFEEIYGSRKLEDMLFTHIPVHPESLRHNWTNVHGHVHSNVPALHFGPRYVNICVEVTEYRPLAFEEVRQRVREQREENQRITQERIDSIKNRFRGLGAPVLDDEGYPDSFA